MKKDFVAVTGVAAITVGVAMISVPVATIVAGLAIVAVALLIGLAEQQQKGAAGEQGKQQRDREADLSSR